MCKRTCAVQTCTVEGFKQMVLTLRERHFIKTYPNHLSDTADTHQLGNLSLN